MQGTVLQYGCIAAGTETCDADLAHSRHRRVKTGSRIAAKLTQMGRSVRRGSRSAPIPFDWEAPSTWTAALDGVSAAYVSYFSDLAFPGAVEKVEALCKIARWPRSEAAAFHRQREE